MKVVLQVSPTVVVEPTREEMNNALTVFYRDVVASGNVLSTREGTVNGDPVCVIVARGSDAVALTQAIREAMDDDDDDDDDDDEEDEGDEE